MSRKQSTSKLLLRGLLLKPLGAAFGAVTAVRNKMFDCGMLQQRSFDIPVLVVGNIAVGGTGKTPHTEYLIDLLRNHYHIGVLSRGYNRRTKGFRLADETCDAATVGDEPFQIYHKFGPMGVMVAVCEDRCEGIDRMREIDPKLDLIILDDAFQHRYVKPTVSVVLTEFGHPVFKDSMLPAGRLRESISALHRADIVVVTKCPDEMKQIDYRLFEKHLGLFAYQKLFFSRYSYGALTPLFPDDVDRIPRLESQTSADTIVVLAGVANPTPFVRFIKKSAANRRYMIFPDHHNFTRNDILALIEKIKSAPIVSRAIVVTTEKDAMRLRDFAGLPKSLRRRIFYVPIQVQVLDNPAGGTQSGSREFTDSLLKLLADGGQQ